MSTRIKVSKDIIIPESSPSDIDECFVVKSCAIYVLRLLEKSPVMDRGMIEFTAWILGADIQTVWNFLMTQFSEQEKNQYDEEFEECMDDFDEISRTIIRIIKKLKSSTVKTFYKHIQDILLKKSKLNIRNRRSDIEKN